MVFESFLQDVRYGVRLLRQAPLFALVTVASIALGLAAGLGAFTVVNALVLRPMVPGGDDIYRIYTANRGGSRFGSSSYTDYRDFTRAGALRASCATDGVRANVTVGTVSFAHSGAVVSGDCFAVLGLRAHVGRLLGSSNASEVVISYALWNRRFAADPGVVGTNVLVNGQPATLVGVAQRGFNGTSLDDGADFWVPIERFGSLLPPRALEDRGHRSLTVFARLRDGASPARAEAELAGIAASLHRDNPSVWSNERGAPRRVTVMREVESRFAGSSGAVAAMLLGVTAVVTTIVSIACINIATMVLARGAARTRELTIRLAVGASRRRLLRQLATETLLVAVLGASIALAAVSAGIRVFEARWPEGVPAVNLAIDWRVASFAIAVALLATVLCGLLPARHVVRLAIAEGMKQRAVAWRSRWIRAGAREALIVIQVAVSVAALVVSALFVRGLSAGAARSPGFATEGVITIGVDLGTAADDRSSAALPQRLLDTVAGVPNVATPSIASVIPLSGAATGFVIGDGTDRRSEVDGNAISPGYLSTMGIALRRGRDFTERDREGAPQVAIVSETFARRFWNTTDVIGRTIPSGKDVYEVVGVVADTRYRSVSEPYPPLLYVPAAQAQMHRFIIHARVRGGGETLAAMEAAARSVDPRIIIDGARSISQRLEDVRLPERLASWIGGAAGVVQFSLVLMALWALVAYSVQRRTHEIGVRIALGATRGGVIALLVKPALLLILAGAVVGSGAGITAALVLQSEFVGLGELEPLAGLPVIAVIAAVAALAALVPARRATRVDPIITLRAE